MIEITVQVTGLPSGEYVIIRVDTDTEEGLELAFGSQVQGSRAAQVRSGENFQVLIVLEPDGYQCDVTDGSGIAAEDMPTAVVTCNVLSNTD